MDVSNFHQERLRKEAEEKHMQESLAKEAADIAASILLTQEAKPLYAFTHP